MASTDKTDSIATRYSNTRYLNREQLWACRNLACTDTMVIHAEYGNWTAVQDRDTIYVFNTDRSLAGDDWAVDVCYVDARGDRIGYIHVDDDFLNRPNQYLDYA